MSQSSSGGGGSTRQRTTTQVVEQLTQKYIETMETRVKSLKKKIHLMKRIFDQIKVTSSTENEHEYTQLCEMLNTMFQSITESTIEFWEFLEKEILTDNSEISKFSQQKFNSLLQKAHSAAKTVNTIYEKAKEMRQGVPQDSEGGGGVNQTTPKTTHNTGKTKKPKGNVHQQGQSPMLGMFLVVVGVAAIALTLGFQ
jgi:hypothetical protein